jgi:NAD(P)-dependent dehydrogenase (short-subunit alcohol dehydrogenase family)
VWPDVDHPVALNARAKKVDVGANMTMVRNIGRVDTRSKNRAPSLPLGRSGMPNALAHGWVYVASDKAVFVHDHVINVDGGRTDLAVVAS